MLDILLCMVIGVIIAGFVKDCIKWLYRRWRVKSVPLHQQDLLQILKGNEIWLSEAKRWAPKEVHCYFDDQIAHSIAMYQTVLRLGIHSVKPTDTELHVRDKI